MNVFRVLYFSFLCVCVAAAPQTVDDDSTSTSTNVTCPADSLDCQCFNVKKDLDLQCNVGGNEDNLFTVGYKFDSGLLKLSCTCNRTGPHLVASDVFDYLEGVSLSDVSAINLFLCQLPLSNISALFKKWTNISSLRKLYLRSCQPLHTLEEGYLNQLEKLTHLVLESNYLNFLPSGFFQQSLSSLQELSLYDNAIESLGIKHFINLPSLVSLQLGSNNIWQLEPGVFAHLNNLERLHLQKNEIKIIPDNLLQALTNLSILDLSNNKIEKLEENLFQFNVKLTQLGLRMNLFPTLPSGLFRNTKNLTKLDLQGNKNLSSLSSDIFRSLTVLEVLNLSDCILEHSSIDNEVFENLSQLRSLNLSRNRLAHLNPLWFSQLSSLTELDLSGNQLTIIEPNCFAKIRKLTTLHLERNSIVEIDSTTFESLNELTHIYLANNNLTFSEGLVDPIYGRQQSPLQNNIRLKFIDVSYNFITEIMSDWGNMNFLRDLKLHHNSITVLEFGDLALLGNEITVDLRHNKISKFNFKSASEVDVRIPNQNPPKGRYLLIDENPLNCDCDTYYLAQYMNRSGPPGMLYSWTIEAQTLTCQKPDSLKNRQPTSVDPSLLVCPCRGDFFPCTCNERKFDQMVLLDCQQRNITVFPTRLPSLAHYKIQLNLSSNNIDFERLPLLGSTASNLLDPNTNVTSLDLSRNALTSALFESNWWVSLHLRFPFLRRLNLSKNNITMIPSGVVEAWNATPDLTLVLGSNPWNCDCDNRAMLEFLFGSGRIQVEDFNRMACQNGQMFSSLTFNDVCPAVSIALKAVAIAVPLLALCVLALSFILFRYRRVLRAWLYNHGFCLWWVSKNEDEEERDYDAFISYSHLDEDFVINDLVPQLERPPSGQPEFRLCLHYRDWYFNLFKKSFFCNSIYKKISYFNCCH